jgi:hypothetical protein
MVDRVRQGAHRAWAHLSLARALSSLLKQSPSGEWVGTARELYSALQKYGSMPSSLESLVRALQRIEPGLQAQGISFQIVHEGRVRRIVLWYEPTHRHTHESTQRMPLLRGTPR